MMDGELNNSTNLQYIVKILLKHSTHKKAAYNRVDCYDKNKLFSSYFLIIYAAWIKFST